MTIAPVGTAQSILGSLSEEEILTARTVLTDAGLVTPTTRFVYVGLAEPDKSDVLAHLAGDGPAPERRARVMLLDIATGDAADTLISLATGSLLSSAQIDPEIGQLPILDEEFTIVAEFLADDPQWGEALRKRGVDPAKTVAVPLSAGSYDNPNEAGKRIIRSFAFVMNDEKDLPWAHPVDGLCAYVDIIAREVIDIVDYRLYEVPQESGNFDTPEVAGEPLEGLKPIEITQPEGPSFTVDGEHVDWLTWSFDLSFDAREGLILRRLKYQDRDVIYRASINEMVVPYGDPSPNRYWQNYFDTGEYVFGRYTNSLTLGCDCLGEIHYFDATLADEQGAPRTITNAICMHEEDYGTLWKHSDIFNGMSEVRRQRRLVISFFTTVGNYDYGFYWYLYLDGTIELEAKLTGVAFTAAYPEEGSDYQSAVAPGLGLPYHQHLFNARLDMMVDGTANAVEEVDAVSVPMGEGNPWGNAFTLRKTRITEESEGSRRANAEVGRTWHIINTEKTGRMGHHPSYALYAQQNPTLLADPQSSIAKRAAFTTNQVWVTKYDVDERYAAGDYVNQSSGVAGVNTYQEANRPLDGEDIVVWHTFGITHFPRTEDWPIMPVDYSGFTLKPYNFVDKSPVMNVPSTAAKHCHHH
ncbi:primary-amine oxidase [Millisia brevis]|uniref:primary-amine oxidase n=1 Tax=Millisia brevis TaxID=264148 RepID=UPI000836EB13|nr:primary-amine oxidase [Millisia brevis]